MTYGWHTSIYKWHTGDIWVHTSDKRMSDIPLHTSIFERTRMSYVCHSYYCVKDVQIRIFFWSIFSPNAGKYGREKTPCLDSFHVVYLLVCHPHVTRMWFYHAPLIFVLKKYQIKKSSTSKTSVACSNTNVFSIYYETWHTHLIKATRW